MTDLARSFSAHFAGTAIVPDDERYETARALWNGTVDARPVLIAQCRDNDMCPEPRTVFSYPPFFALEPPLSFGNF